MSMSPIQKGIDEILFEIPREILIEAFVNKGYRHMVDLVSLETRIREDVLEPRVFVDIDIQGGTEAYIPLNQGVQADKRDPFTVIYTIPDELTQGRPIVQVYSVHFGILGYQNAGLFAHSQEGALGSQLRRVLDAAKQTPPALTSYLNLIAHNTVMARYVYAPNVDAFMRVRLGNDDALSHIRHQAYHEFAALCVLAAKAHIYRVLRVPMDQGQLSGGQPLGSFLEIVQEYADANTMYKEALVRWKKIAVFNDPEQRRQHIRLISGGF